MSHVMKKEVDCLVPKCSSSVKTCFSWFTFPKDPRCRREWADMCDIPISSITDKSVICFRHFPFDDYDIYPLHLWECVKPSLFLPNQGNANTVSRREVEKIRLQQKDLAVKRKEKTSAKNMKVGKSRKNGNNITKGQEKSYSNNEKLSVDLQTEENAVIVGNSFFNKGISPKQLNYEPSRNENDTTTNEEGASDLHKRYNLVNLTIYPKNRTAFEEMLKRANEKKPIMKLNENQDCPELSERKASATVVKKEMTRTLLQNTSSLNAKTLDSSKEKLPDAVVSKMARRRMRPDSVLFELHQNVLPSTRSALNYVFKTKKGENKRDHFILNQNKTLQAKELSKKKPTDEITSKMGTNSSVDLTDISNQDFDYDLSTKNRKINENYVQNDAQISLLEEPVEEEQVIECSMGDTDVFFDEFPGSCIVNNNVTAIGLPSHGERCSVDDATRLARHISEAGSSSSLYEPKLYRTSVIMKNNNACPSQSSELSVFKESVKAYSSQISDTSLLWKKVLSHSSQSTKRIILRKCANKSLRKSPKIIILRKDVNASPRKSPEIGPLSLSVKEHSSQPLATSTQGKFIHLSRPNILNKVVNLNPTPGTCILTNEITPLFAGSTASVMKDIQANLCQSPEACIDSGNTTSTSGGSRASVISKKNVNSNLCLSPEAPIVEDNTTSTSVGPTASEISKKDVKANLGQSPETRIQPSETTPLSVGSAACTKLMKNVTYSPECSIIKDVGITLSKIVGNVKITPKRTPPSSSSLTAVQNSPKKKRIGDNAATAAAETDKCPFCHESKAVGDAFWYHIIQHASQYFSDKYSGV